MNKILYILILAASLLFFCPASQSVAQYIPNAPFKAVSQRAPDFSLTDLQGQVYKLSSRKGKPILIFFGTTWCPSCRSELPVFKKIYETYAGRGLEVIYVNIMESRAKVVKFARTNSLSFKILLDESGDVATVYGVVGVPTFVLVDKEGKIIKTSHATADLSINKLFSDLK